MKKIFLILLYLVFAGMMYATEQPQQPAGQQTNSVQSAARKAIVKNTHSPLKICTDSSQTKQASQAKAEKYGAASLITAMGSTILAVVSLLPVWKTLHALGPNLGYSFAWFSLGAILGWLSFFGFIAAIILGILALTQKQKTTIDKISAWIAIGCGLGYLALVSLAFLSIISLVPSK